MVTGVTHGALVHTNQQHFRERLLHQGWVPALLYRLYSMGIAESSVWSYLLLEHNLAYPDWYEQAFTSYSTEGRNEACKIRQLDQALKRIRMQIPLVSFRGGTDSFVTMSPVLPLQQEQLILDECLLRACPQNVFWMDGWTNTRSLAGSNWSTATPVGLFLELGAWVMSTCGTTVIRGILFVVAVCFPNILRSFLFQGLCTAESDRLDSTFSVSQHEPGKSLTACLNMSSLIY